MCILSTATFYRQIGSNATSESDDGSSRFVNLLIFVGLRLIRCDLIDKSSIIIYWLSGDSMRVIRTHSQSSSFEWIVWFPFEIPLSIRGKRSSDALINLHRVKVYALHATDTRYASSRLAFKQRVYLWKYRHLTCSYRVYNLRVDGE